MENETEEIWKDAIGYEGLYRISNHCRVYSIVKSKLLKPHLANGYLRFGLRKDGKNKSKYLHRLFALAFMPNPENKREINHKNGIKTDNSFENLEWCTSAENIRHAIRTGLIVHAKFDKNHSTKLTVENVLYIRSNYKRWKYPASRLAKEFNICITTVLSIIHRKKWKSI